jgi:hypothetical protein
VARRELLLSVVVWAITGLMLFAQLASYATRVQLVRQTVTEKMLSAPMYLTPASERTAGPTAQAVFALVV